jgi:hypothetical protein
MKIIAKSKKEFNLIVKASKELHDNFSINTDDPIINTLAHLYRIKHAHLEGANGIEESKALKKMFYIAKKSKKTRRL